MASEIYVERIARAVARIDELPRRGLGSPGTDGNCEPSRKVKCGTKYHTFLTQPFEISHTPPGIALRASRGAQALGAISALLDLIRDERGRITRQAGLEPASRGLDGCASVTEAACVSPACEVCHEVENRLSEATAVHWHGIELEGDYDIGTARRTTTTLRLMR
jgi:hypothetical protein